MVVLKKIYLWDLPTRLFHWLLALTIAAAFITVNLGGNWMIWHGRAGFFAIGLVVFRLIWGFIGARASRFTFFVRGPNAIMAYIRGQWQGIGHNPLGALSVLALLGVVFFQAVSGLFSTDDIAFAGPLNILVSESLGELITRLHRACSTLLVVLIGLHLAAVVFYVRWKKHNIVKPMLTGWADESEQVPALAPTRFPALIAFIFAASIATGVAWAFGSGWVADQFKAPAPKVEKPAAPSW